MSSSDIQKTTDSFLEQSDASVVLLMANEKNPEPLVVQSIYDMPDPTKKTRILDQWIRRANEYNDAVPPNGSSRISGTEHICDVATPAVSFPGFSVLSKIRLGVKFVQDKGKGAEYQFVQLSDTTEARGLRPLVWAHDKVTGKAQTSDSGRQRARSFCTLRSIVQNDKEDGRSSGSVRFEYKVYLEVQLEFSRVWVKVLPVPLERVNGWGSAALTKTVEQNAPQNLQRLASAFETFLANQSKDSYR